MVDAGSIPEEDIEPPEEPESDTDILADEFAMTGLYADGTTAKRTHCPSTCRYRQPLVSHRDETAPTDCPYGHVQRIVTGGEGGVANVHVVRVTEGATHVHTGYDEVYYVLSGSPVTADRPTPYSLMKSKSPNRS